MLLRQVFKIYASFIQMKPVCNFSPSTQQPTDRLLRGPGQPVSVSHHPGEEQQQAVW